MNTQEKQVWRSGKAYPVGPNYQTPAEKAVRKLNQPTEILAKGPSNFSGWETNQTAVTDPLTVAGENHALNIALSNAWESELLKAKTERDQALDALAFLRNMFAFAVPPHEMKDCYRPAYNEASKVLRSHGRV